MGFAHLGKCWGKARPAGEGERLGDATRKIRWINSSWWLDEASHEPSSRGSARGFQPALQIRRTEDIEEGFCQGFQLLQGQALTVQCTSPWSNGSIRRLHWPWIVYTAGIMPLNIRSEEANQLAAEVAILTGET